MDPTELFAIAAIFIGAPWAVFTGIAKVKAAGVAQKGGMRRSELRQLVEEAVEEATAPLRARIEALETIATEDEHTTRRLDAALLADLEGPEPATDDVPAAVRHRTRS